jgi:hypothetical protein
VRNISVTSIQVPIAASMSAQVAARPNKVVGEASPQVAGEAKSALAIKEKEKPSLLVDLKNIEAQIAARAIEARNVNVPDVSFNRTEIAQSAKVEQQQAADLSQELKLRDYKEVAYSRPGFKGAHVDLKA